MPETGWPLIPRDALPDAPPGGSRPPVRPAGSSAAAGKGARGRADAGRQLSIFGAETTEPSPLDLMGLLAGPGRLDRMGGTARVSVRVDRAWRVHVLVAELVTRGLVVTWRPFDDEPAASGADGTVTEATSAEVRPEQVARVSCFEVRTAYSSRLTALARTWPPASDRLFLTGPGLRLWVAAAGRPVDGGYALGWGSPGISVDVALRRAGLDGALSDHGPHYLISGRKPLQRLAELVGGRPAAAPAEVWPGDAGA